MLSLEGVEACLKLPITTILDIGSGMGEQAKVFKRAGKRVTQIDLISTNSTDHIQGDYLLHDFENTKFDLVWASHILEHQLNVNTFLTKCRNDVNEGGFICITVPPLKHNIVGGHVTLWNAGLVLYNLVLAGFDCSAARIKCYGYNISVIAQAGTFKVPELKYDYGDIETINKWLPYGFNYQGFNGDIKEFNWRK
jgi:SAM-dependent methyltransferase